MLDRLRKRIGDLIGGTDASPADANPGVESPASVQLQEEAPPPSAAVGAEASARREARKREARLILSERIHNRATTLISEVRNRLLQEIQRRIEQETASSSLQELLQVTLDPAFTRRLDGLIAGQVDEVLKGLQESFQADPDSDAFFPSPDQVASELKAYRDQILRTHVLEQLEVLALPPLATAFPEGKVQPEELRQKLAEYWKACREALDRFFRSVEMAILNGARPGIRLDASIIRDRLVAAQYRNGYRALEERFRALYGKVADLQMRADAHTSRDKLIFDRQVIDEIIVPLAFFIRDRAEPEPREALRTRAELFRNIVDKLVVTRDPFPQTAESLKPLLRRSIDHARPLALESFPYLRSSIESLKPTEIHRATALVQLFEALVMPEVDEQTLQAVEQAVRLSRWQYHLYLALGQAYADLARRLQPLDRIHSEDAEFLTKFIESNEPPPEAVEDLTIRLGYLDLPEDLGEDSPRRLLRALAILTLPRSDLTTLQMLYDPQPPDPADLARVAKMVLRQLRPTSVGADDRQQQLGAVPLPVDLSRALGAIGYHPEYADRLNPFREELEQLITSGEPRSLARAVEMLRRLSRAMDKERVSLGLVGMEGDPYVSEVWLKESGDMVGLVFYRRKGYGLAPIERVTRKAANGNRTELHQNLRRQLSSQAVVYQAFHRLFSSETQLPRSRRQALPTYLKTTYERIEPNRRGLLAHLRNARLVIKRIEEFSGFIGEADRQSRNDAVTLARIMSGLSAKLEQLQGTVERAPPAEMSRIALEYERVVRYLNVVILHSVDPWLERQTRGLATEYDFREEEVVEAIRAAATSRGLDWDNDVERHEAHRIRGTLGCRALLQLSDGSSKVVLLEYDRRRRAWQVKHFGPRITDVIQAAAQRFGKSLPEEYDEKYEQPTFRLEEQSCRYLLVKRGVARVEATVVLDPAQAENPWNVVFLKWNEEVLIDQSSGLASDQR